MSILVINVTCKEKIYSSLSTLRITAVFAAIAGKKTFSVKVALAVIIMILNLIKELRAFNLTN